MNLERFSILQGKRMKKTGGVRWHHRIFNVKFNEVRRKNRKENIWEKNVYITRQKHFKK